MSSAYCPLWCKSNYSFLVGASHPEELIQQAAHLQFPALALTDLCGVYGVVRGWVESRASFTRLLVGCELPLAEGGTLLLWVQNPDGYASMCKLLSTGQLRAAKGECRIFWSDFASTALPGLLVGWPASIAPAAEYFGPLRELYGDRFYGLLIRHYQPGDRQREQQLRKLAAQAQVRLLAGTEVLYHDRCRRPLQDILSSIRHKVPIYAAGTRLRPNAGHALLPTEPMARLYADDPDSLKRTLEIAERCQFSMAQLHYRYPEETMADGRSSWQRLRDLTVAGAGQRYGEELPVAVAEQIERELLLIRELDYSGYFLTMWEIVRFCRERGILCQGRGSAANSIVCYCLAVTAIDPIRMDLLFERFISRERAEPPDIDLDIEHQRREEVIQYVYQRYGRDRAAMVANVVRYRGRSALRDVGGALGVAMPALEKLARRVPHYSPLTEAMLRETGLDSSIPVHRQLYTLSNQLQGFPRHLSIHPGGFVLGDRPLHELVPVEPGTMPGRTVIQWDKEDVESLGLFKVDLLGLGALTHLHGCFDLLRQQYGVEMDMAAIPPRDTATYDMLSRGDAIGVFQVESRAQLSMLPRLRPRHFYDLVVEISLIRPGPISGGMVHPYLRRRKGEEPVTYPHPSLQPVLAKTLGVPLFQEQVMRLAMVAADYSPGEADQLRRDMAAWQRSGRIERHHAVLVERMVAKGIAVEFAEQVFAQIRGFGEYGFPESHAASFALIAYATAWLRCHYPEVFYCGLLNAWPMGFYSPATLLGDARCRGITVLPISVSDSDRHCTLEATAGGFALRIGLRFIKGLSEDALAQLLAVRKDRAFTDYADLVRRSSLDRGALERLVKAGATDTFGTRRDLLWSTPVLLAGRSISLPFTTPQSQHSFPPLQVAEGIMWDYHSSGMSTLGHPLFPLRERLRREGFPTAAEVHSMPHGGTAIYAGLVICRQRPGTAGGVTFVTLEDETGLLNLIVWPKLGESSRLLLRTASFLAARGTVQVAEGIVHLIAEQLWLPHTGAAVTVASRDYH